MLHKSHFAFRALMTVVGLVLCLGLIAPTTAAHAEEAAQLRPVGKTVSIADFVMQQPTQHTTPACVANRQSAPTAQPAAPNVDLVLSITSPIPAAGATVVTAVPYSFDLTFSVTNAGSDATSTGYMVYVYAGKEKPFKFNGKKLTAGAKQDFKIRANYTSGGIQNLDIYVDANCQILEPDKNNVEKRSFYIRTPDMDMAAFGTALVFGGTIIGDGIRVGDTYTPIIGIANFGSKVADTDFVVRSDYYGVANLLKEIAPGPGKISFYSVGGGTPYTATKVGKVAYKLVISLKDEVLKDNATDYTFVSNASYKSRADGYVYPAGADLQAYATTPCAVAIGTVALRAHVDNGGNQASGQFTLQLVVDGKKQGSPQTVNSVAGGGSLHFDINATISNAGSHSFIVIVRPLDFKDYNSKNNRDTENFFAS